MFHIALHEPRIAPNTGNIIRLIANNGCHLHLIEPMGFDLDEKKVRRAGLDYHDLAQVTRHRDYAAFLLAVTGRRIFACTTKGKQWHTTAFSHAKIQAGDVLLFGSETAGLPKEVLASIADEFTVRIPMLKTNRSMNLSNAVAVMSYEAWRQIGYAGGC